VSSLLERIDLNGKLNGCGRRRETMRALSVDPMGWKLTENPQSGVDRLSDGSETY
jgi:hypothetical protein